MGSLYSLEKLQDQERPLNMGPRPGGEQCGQCVGAPLSLLTQSPLVSVAQGVIWSHPYVVGFSQWCLDHEWLLVVLLMS